MRKGSDPEARVVMKQTLTLPGHFLTSDAAQELSGRPGFSSAREPPPSFANEEIEAQKGEDISWGHMAKERFRDPDTGEEMVPFIVAPRCLLESSGEPAQPPHPGPLLNRWETRAERGVGASLWSHGAWAGAQGSYPPGWGWQGRPRWAPAGSSAHTVGERSWA